MTLAAHGSVSVVI